MSNTVRVRIAVAVDSKGVWNSFGYDGQQERESVDNAQEFMASSDGDVKVSWVEADVPLPTRDVVSGEVKP